MGVGVSAKGKGQLQEVQGCFPRFEQLPYSHGIRYETTDIGYGMRVPSPVLTERVTAHFVTIKSEQQNKKASAHRCFLQ